MRPTHAAGHHAFQRDDLLLRHGVDASSVAVHCRLLAARHVIGASALFSPPSSQSCCGKLVRRCHHPALQVSPACLRAGRACGGAGCPDRTRWCGRRPRAAAGGDGLCAGAHVASSRSRRAGHPAPVGAAPRHRVLAASGAGDCSGSAATQRAGGGHGRFAQYAHSRRRRNHAHRRVTAHLCGHRTAVQSARGEIRHPSLSFWRRRVAGCRCVRAHGQWYPVGSRAGAPGCA